MTTNRQYLDKKLVSEVGSWREDLKFSSSENDSSSTSTSKDFFLSDPILPTCSKGN